MSDCKIFAETNGAEIFPNNQPPREVAQEQEESRRIAFYGKQGEVIFVEPPSEEEIAELLYRLENGDMVLTSS
jgi:hypothetical protein